MPTIKNLLDDLENEVVNYNYTLRRENPHMDKVKLSSHIRRKVNKKFSLRLKQIFSLYFISRTLGKNMVNSSRQ